MGLTTAARESGWQGGGHGVQPVHAEGAGGPEIAAGALQGAFVHQTFLYGLKTPSLGEGEARVPSVVRGAGRRMGTAAGENRVYA